MEINNNHDKYDDYKQMGILELIIGPMYSGKTSALIEYYNQFIQAGLDVMVINYDEDKRYDSNKLSSHDKNMIDCYMFHNLNEIFNNEKYFKEYSNAKIILINEGQFFQDLKECVIKMVENDNKYVYIAALDGDFLRNPFQNIMELIPLSDYVIKKKAICKNCNNHKEAIFSKRISNETEVKVIGTDNYLPVCRTCYHNT
jgi:thymidine kinase